jgi:hypothetical protein
MQVSLNVVLAIASPVVSAGAAFLAYKAKTGVHEIHLLINSRMDQWMTAAREAAHAQGADSVRADALAKALLQTAANKALILLASAEQSAAGKKAKAGRKCN